MTKYLDKAPKPRRGVGSAAATRKWRLAKDIKEMRDAREDRERKAALDYIHRRRADEVDYRMDPREWGKQVAFQALDQVVAVSRVADGLPDVHLSFQAFADKTMAYTDFASVNVSTAAEDLPNRDRMDEVAERIATLKGVAYHEIGHIKYTYRPWLLWPDKTEAWAYKNVWNILEDQRMESRAAQTNHRLVSLFTIMVSNIVIAKTSDSGGQHHSFSQIAQPNNWILLAGREYLPDEVKWAAFNDCPWDEEDRETWFQLVAAYKRAKTPDQLIKAVKDAYDWLSDQEDMDTEGVWYRPDGVDEHDWEAGEGAAGSQPGPSAGDGATEDKDAKDGTPRPGKDGDLEVTDQSLLEAVIKAKRDAVDEFKKTGEAQAAVSRVNTSASSASFPSPGDRLQAPMEPAVLATAEAMAEGMKRALSSFQTATDPHWESRQELGVLDALAYRTREPGNKEYRRRRIDHDDKGRNVHVSLLCDISGSMHGEPMLALSMALYATAKACDDLDIGRTMMLWSTEYYQLWADGAPTPTVWNSCGGTQPIPALDTLDEHNTEEADNHLVMVFTDGAWYDQAPLTTWGGPGRRIIVLHYGSYQNTQDLGADEEIHIDNVTDIPDLLAQRIGDLMFDEE